MRVIPLSDQEGYPPPPSFFQKEETPYPPVSQYKVGLPPSI